MSIEAERIWLMIAIQLGKLANDIRAENAWCASASCSGGSTLELLTDEADYA